MLLQVRWTRNTYMYELFIFVSDDCILILVDFTFSVWDEKEHFSPFLGFLWNHNFNYGTWEVCFLLIVKFKQVV